MDTKELKEFYLKYKAIIWPGITGLSAIAILFLLVIPQFSDYLETRKQIYGIRERFQALDAKAEELEGIDDSAAKQNLEAVFTVLPTEQDVPGAVATLQDLILKSGLVLKDISYSASSVGGGNKNSFKLNVSVLGQLGSVRNFLIGLQDSPRVFQIESINARFQNNGSVVEAEMPLFVYYEGAPNRTVSLDQPVAKLTEKEEQMLSRLMAQIPKATQSGSVDVEVSVPLGKTNPFE